VEREILIINKEFAIKAMKVISVALARKVFSKIN
jgi:hypothetical protein